MKYAASFEGYIVRMYQVQRSIMHNRGITLVYLYDIHIYYAPIFAPAAIIAFSLYRCLRQSLLIKIALNKHIL